ESACLDMRGNADKGNRVLLARDDGETVFENYFCCLALVLTECVGPYNFPLWGHSRLQKKQKRQNPHSRLLDVYFTGTFVNVFEKHMYRTRCLKISESVRPLHNDCSAGRIKDFVEPKTFEPTPLD